MFVICFCVFVVGSLLGSFANVCIWRLPRGESIFLPGSRCPSCKHPIRWWDNIPILSFCILKGECRWCGARISCQYPVVELIGGVGLLTGWLKLGPGFDFLFFTIFFFILLIISGIDFYHQIIPDKLSYPLILLGLLYSILRISNQQSAIINSLYSVLSIVNRQSSIINSLAGLLAGGGFLWLAGLLGKKIYRKEAMGGGDVKLAAGIGAWLGLAGVAWAIMLGAGIGALSGISLIVSKKRKRTDPIPFGPFLSAGAILVLLLKS